MLGFIVTLLLLSPHVLGHFDGMDMSMDNGMSMTMGNMLMFLHFTPGDNLWFFGWAPNTPYAVFGTCIGLFLLALVERWLASMKAVMQSHWHVRALVELANRTNSGKTPVSRSTPLTRTSLPFIFSHDLPRGIITAVLALIGFSFMLVIMTYQVSYILSIVIGLGVGEMLFGRFAASTTRTHP